ncbi:CpaD family pilus assembly protein [uncultured Maricaulis sp.]|uniref:CpaD family pilus assembly protein n=1 Tax=uncultured Maricaulis sp. TaxID=174710 RepID=UPI0030D926D2
MLKSSAKLLLIALFGSVTLAACSTTPVGLDLPQPTAVAETYRADMAVDPRDNGLTWAQQGMLSAIATEYKVRGHGPLVISYPQGAANEDAAIGVIAASRTYLYEQGLDWRQIAGGAYDARRQGNAAVIFSFTRYRAVAPDCMQSWEDQRPDFDNRHSERFGCSLATNLAAMISDPRDLIAPRTMGPSDAGRRQTVLEGYRAGESTTSERSDHESGAVSTIGN